MPCKFCMAEMLRMILDNQKCQARALDAKIEMIAMELLRHITSTPNKEAQCSR